MKLLLNDKELAYFINSLYNHWSESIKENVYTHDKTFECLKEWKLDINAYKKSKKRKPYRVGKRLYRLQQAVAADLQKYIDKIEHLHNERSESYFKCIHKNMDHFINKFGKENIFKLYKKSKFQNFVKSTGITINPNATLMRRQDFTDYTQDCLIRNTTGNEQLLVQKIDNRYPFWFIDSGYTNFLETKKKWHRLVRNHIHHDKTFEAHVDRLSNFKSFPKPWKLSGEKILIIEPGPFAAGIFHVDLKTWKYDVERELRKYTDKKIVFREKAEKKIRTSLYEDLNNEDYYCLVNINSNAATEAVWSGVPVITLDKHITSSISRNKLSDINNLARPHLANWLCALSYSQFTKEELYDGTAIDILRKYHV
jgi:hypothetical protein